MSKHLSRFLLSTLTIVAIAATGVAVTAPAFAASFNCSKATSAVEKAICSSAETSDLDEYLGRYYAGARSSLKHAESCIVDDQRTWLRTIRDQCKTTPCLKRAYLDRLAVLHALQPGAVSLKNIELPMLPPLVWIVPPALDQVAAPRNRPTNAFVANGKIVDEIATGDGYVLQTTTGAKHLIVTLMFLEQPTADALAALSQLPKAAFEVRGRTDAAAGGTKAFASSQCTFVYRTTP
jgi:uncharacterized protein